MSSNAAPTSVATGTLGQALADGSHPRRWIILAVVGMAQFMVMLDATVVNVALPSIQNQFNASTSSLQWVVDAYVLVFGSLLLLGGRAADSLGRRRVFLAGLALFTVASVVCGFAGSAGLLIGARAAQGLGAALLSPAALSVIVTSFRDPGERRTAMTIWAALAAIGGTLGVVMGGALIEVADWRWAFWVNAPVGVITALAALRVVPQLRPSGGTRRAFDLPGALLAAGALALLIFGLISVSEHSWTSTRTLGSLAGSVVLFIALGVVQSRSADPLIPVRLLAIGPLLLSAIGLLLVAGMMMSLFFMVSVYEQRVLGFNPLEAGLGVVGLGLPTILIFPLVPKLMGRFGPPRVYLGGALLLLVGTLLLAWLPTATSSYATGLLPGLAVLGLGIPCCFAPLNAMGVSTVRPAESGVASGVLTTFNQTGAALGMATVITLAAAHTRTLIASGQSAHQALTDGFHWGYLALVGVAVVKILLALYFNLRRKQAQAAG